MPLPKNTKDLNGIRDFFTHLKNQFASASTVYQEPIKQLFDELTARLQGVRALLTGDQLGDSYLLPEQWDTDYEFVPRVDGVAQGAVENVRLYRVNFTFAEILPLYPVPAVAKG